MTTAAPPRNTPWELFSARLALFRHGAAYLLLTAWLPLAPPAMAQIVTDGTVGPRATLTGPSMTIGAELGTTRGANLFHSFLDFNIQTGESATFTGPSQIQNVIGRVTGGQASSIDGTLRSTVGQADVYLVNPSGVVMGPNARVDVPASLHVSTADELRFQDGSRFSAREPAASTLTVAAPESFGFLAPQPAGLTITGSSLEVKPGKTLSLTAGDVLIAGTANQRASLKAPGGTLRVEAVGSAGGAVPVGTPSTAPGSGTLTIGQADLESSGDGGGRIAVRAGAATLTAATLAADNRGDLAPAGGLDLALDQGLTLSASRLRSNSFADGASGGARVAAGSLRIEQADADLFTGVMSEVEPGARGAAGGVTVAIAGGIEMRGAVGIASATFGIGDSGSVTVSANDLLLDGQGRSVPHRETTYIAGISSEAGRGSSGRANAVRIQITDALTVRNRAGLSSSTLGIGAGGTLTVHAGTLLLDGAWLVTDASSGSSGDAGTVQVTVDGLLEVLNGAKIGSNTWAAGRAGTVAVTARDLRVDGSLIASAATSSSTGSVGNIAIQADHLTLTNGAEITIAADQLTPAAANAPGATIQINAEEMRLETDSRVTTESRA